LVIIKSLENSDIASIRRDLQNEKERLGPLIETLRNWENVFWCQDCEHSLTLGRYEHNNGDCPTHNLNNVECPFEELDKLNNRENRINTLSLLTSCFRNPETALGQRTLKGMAIEEGCLYRDTYGYHCATYEC